MDGGAAVGDRDEQEIGEGVVEAGAGIGVDPARIGDGGGEERVEVFAHHRALEADHRGGRGPDLPTGGIGAEEAVVVAAQRGRIEMHHMLLC